MIVLFQPSGCAQRIEKDALEIQVVDRPQRVDDGADDRLGPFQAGDGSTPRLPPVDHAPHLEHRGGLFADVAQHEGYGRHALQIGRRIGDRSGAIHLTARPAWARTQA